MMEINRNNYESFFVDYLEGTLDEKLVDNFIEFLQQNPDLKEELSLFEPVAFHPENINFSKKDKLYKEIYDAESEFNKAAIARLEGDLSEIEKNNFEIYLVKHPEKQKEAELFSKTKIIPYESITFYNKNKLYHKTAGKMVLFWAVRIAAVLILAIVFYILSDSINNKISSENKLALVEKQSPIIETTPKIEQVQQVPIIIEEENDSVQTEKIKSKPEIKNTVLKTKSAKSLRETNKERIENEDLVRERVLELFPEKMDGFTASLEIPKQQGSLAAMSFKSIEIEYTVNDERLIADVVKEKTGLENLSFDKIKKAGLNLVADFTKDNFSYVTNNGGQITEINFDSRLFAFTIPTRNNKDEN